MPPSGHLLRTFLTPTALSLSLSIPFLRPFSSTSPTHAPNFVTRFRVLHPSPTASRESPTPLVFVRAPRISAALHAPGETKDLASAVSDGEGWRGWNGMFAEKGYTGIEIDVAAPPVIPDSPSEGLDAKGTTPLAAMTNALASQIRLQAIPFPPVLIAEGEACVLTQGYISDNPASGLVLINPPHVGHTGAQAGSAAPADAGEVRFDYEPHFPILVMGSGPERLRTASERGLGRGGKGVTWVEQRDADARGEKNRIVRCCASISARADDM